MLMIALPFILPRAVVVAVALGTAAVSLHGPLKARPLTRLSAAQAQLLQAEFGHATPPRKSRRAR